jgi:hypothetical protein
VKGDNEMKRAFMIRWFLSGALVMGLVFCGGSLLASQNPLTGKVWVTMSQDQKVGYLWGAGDVVDVEQELMSRFPELKVENFSMKVLEGLGDVAMNDIIATVDRWYETNPDKLDVAVLRVIWDNMIKPNLTTGIAGRPLQ